MNGLKFNILHIRTDGYECTVIFDITNMQFDVMCVKENEIIQFACNASDLIDESFISNKIKSCLKE